MKANGMSCDMRMINYITKAATKDAKNMMGSLAPPISVQKQDKIASIWLGSAPSVRWMIWYKSFTVAEDSYY